MKKLVIIMAVLMSYQISTAQLIKNKTWTCKEIITLSDTIRMTDDKFSVFFYADGNAICRTDCNDFFGTYTADKDKLSYVKESGTKMFCPDSFESEFMDFFSGAKSFIVADGGKTLTICLKNQGKMIFKCQK